MKKTLIATVLALGAAFSVQAKDIVDTAVAAGNFKTLATALTAAGLIDTLKGKGPFTVFAPTDAAFAKIPKADLDALIKDKAKLTDYEIADLQLQLKQINKRNHDLVGLAKARWYSGICSNIHKM